MKYLFVLVLLSALCFFPVACMHENGDCHAVVVKREVADSEGNSYRVTLSGDLQDGDVRAFAPRPILLTVSDSNNNRPAAGMGCLFQLIGREGAKLVAGRLSKTRLYLNTDEKGQAQVLLKFGKDIGVYKVEVVFFDKSRKELFRHECRETAVAWQKLLFGVFGGLGLFLFGMKMMTDSLQQLAGDRLKYILEVLTRHRLVGLAVGALVTAIIQSSSATTVMLVGFLNAGLMQLEQAIPIIFGANIGTTITGQMIAFKLGKYALPFIGVAFLMIMGSQRKKYKTAGYVLMGFGLLFLGMGTMSGVFKPLRSSPIISGAFMTFGANPLLGFLTGLVMTLILQSSSATVGLVITMAGAGLLSFEAAVPIVFGTNVGTTVTAVLASLAANREARRSAVVHVSFNLFGSLIMLLSLYVTDAAGRPIYYLLVDKLTAGDVFATNPENVARHVANAHTIFNVIFGFAFLPFTAFFARLARWIIRGDGSRRVTLLEEHLLDNPELALKMSIVELEHMLRISRSMLVDSMQGIFKRDDRFYTDIPEREQEVDELQAAITGYLVKLSQHRMGEREATLIPYVLHSVNDIERLGDLCENIMELGERLIGRNLPLTEKAEGELRTLYGKVLEMAERVLLCLTTDDREQALSARHVEHDINRLEDLYRRNHIKRLKDGECNPVSGIIFLDIIGNLEKIADRLDNVAKAFSKDESLPVGF